MLIVALSCGAVAFDGSLSESCRPDGAVPDPKIRLIVGWLMDSWVAGQMQKQKPEATVHRSSSTSYSKATAYLFRAVLFPELFGIYCMC